jgi:hypothetical protein
MSTSLLYHAFGLRGYDYVNTAGINPAARYCCRKIAHGDIGCPAGAERRMVS